jgi:aldehyde dehydrogenase (NAD+)
MRQAETLRHYIGAEWVDGAQQTEIRNPSDTREVVATSPVGRADDVARAVAEARAAYPAWADTSPEVRADLLDRVGQMILDRRDDLALLLSREEGKTLADSIAETVRAGRIFRYFAGEAVRCHGKTLASTRPGLDVQTFREPVGVFGLITPWNFPIAIPAWKAAPALAF